jgi:leucyl-tRNA synthetase
VGADALRLYHLFVGPPADDVDWTDETDKIIDGCARYLARVWRLAMGEVEAVEMAEATAPPGPPGSLERATHKLIARVSDDYARWSYNTAVAACMEFTNLLYKHVQAGTERASLKLAIDSLLLLMAPMVPHITAELWERRHPGEHIHELSWPTFDADRAAALTATMVVQVNGKVRDRLEVDAAIGAEEMERLALASPKVQATLDGRAPRKVVTRPPKLVNVVV